MKLTVDDIIFLHKELIDEFDGDSGIRDMKLLESAVYTPYQTYGGEDIYEGPIEKGVRLCYSLVMNHPFVDGNKRIGAHALVIFLDANGYPLEYEESELTKIILDLASSKLSDKDLLDWVKAHIN